MNKSDKQLRNWEDSKDGKKIEKDKKKSGSGRMKNRLKDRKDTGKKEKEEEI